MIDRNDIVDDVEEDMLTIRLTGTTLTLLMVEKRIC